MKRLAPPRCRQPLRLTGRRRTGDLFFGGGTFDAVVANNMLCHVPDLRRALSEIVRLLKPIGSLYTTTVDQDHMREMGWMLTALNPDHPQDESIWYYLESNLENGTEHLSRLFSEVSLIRYEGALAVTETRALLDYVLSTPIVQSAADRTIEGEFHGRVAALETAIQWDLASRGEIHISKHMGMFFARR